MAAAEEATTPVPASAEARVQAIFAVFDVFGNGDYIGEAVSQEQHAIQCAKLAADAGSDDATIAGALLHDIGHMIGMRDGAAHMEHCGIHNHERLGQAFCKDAGLPPKVGSIVAGHVQAKRYLCWKNPTYHATLSEASQTTLRHQGGPMSDDEARTFEADPLFATIIRMRTWDEKAKVTDWTGPSLASYRPLLMRLIETELLERASA